MRNDWTAQFFFSQSFSPKCRQEFRVALNIGKKSYFSLQNVKVLNFHPLCIQHNRQICYLSERHHTPIDWILKTQNFSQKNNQNKIFRSSFFICCFYSHFVCFVFFLLVLSFVICCMACFFWISTRNCGTNFESTATERVQFLHIIFYNLFSLLVVVNRRKITKTQKGKKTNKQFHEFPPFEKKKISPVRGNRVLIEQKTNKKKSDFCLGGITQHTPAKRSTNWLTEQDTKEKEREKIQRNGEREHFKSRECDTISNNSIRGSL